MDMDGMNGDHVHGKSRPENGEMHQPHKIMMHMTFFWGKNAEILFSGWPGSDSGMYVLALAVIFLLSILVEWLAHGNLVGDGSNRVASGLARTLVHAVRVGLAYMVMLAVMSFNGGVFLAAVAGHALGFLLFGSGVFKKPATVGAPPSGKTSDVPSMSC